MAVKILQVLTPKNKYTLTIKGALPLFLIYFIYMVDMLLEIKYIKTMSYYILLSKGELYEQDIKKRSR
ncbi:hypothetical protein ROGSH02058M1_l10420 [Raoultella ornithinolytica]|nr:hypothetical protein ROGSH02058M1_l10420 [Raoultella ornithinolytica]